MNGKNPASQTQNPWMGTVSKSQKQDGSEQVNMKMGSDSVNINKDASGNVSMTQTQQVDFSKVMPFTSMQPAAAAMDQIFGTRMQQSIPSQNAMVQNYRMLQGRESDPLQDLRRQKLLGDLEAQTQNKRLRELANKRAEQENQRKKKLSAAQAAEKIAREQEIRDKKKEKYSDKLAREGIPDLVDNLKEVHDIMASSEDIPGVGQTGMLPDITLSQKGQSLRASMQRLFDKTLRERTGAAATNKELRNLQKEFENSIGKSDVAARRAAKKYVSKLAEIVRNMRSGLPIEGIEAYEADGGRKFVDEIDALTFDYNPTSIASSPSELDAKMARLKELRAKQSALGGK